MLETPKKRYCVVTPYYKEDRAMIEHCLGSVRRQTVAADHVMVADGFPQAWLFDAPGVRHLTLDRPHRDYGDFARGVGALMAVAEKYDGICFLDADNWYDDDHIETCLKALEAAPGSVYAAARRKFVRPDHSLIPSNPAEVPFAEHIDTNCFFFLPMAYQVLHRWCTIPQELSPSGDHLFYLALVTSGSHPAVVTHPTVNYLYLFEELYRSLGEAPPAGVKPLLNWQNQQDWLNTLSPADLALARSLTGLALFQQ